MALLALAQTERAKDARFIWVIHLAAVREGQLLPVATPARSPPGRRKR